ncbi:MAG: hypothetical protein D3910_01945 [Candidatus Electrothrix sp. ATG2]|nr:hypothetical protein [Candidatus Electrothrix sp. ATG2]
MKDFEVPDNGEERTDFSETIPEQFIVTEKELDQELYDQFIAESEWVDPQPDYANLIRQGEQLTDKTMPIAQKKLSLVQLACRGTAEAYRLVQEYCTRPDSGLEEWSKIALYECRMRMESDLLDEPVGLISTGLGGDGQRLRFIFVLALLGEGAEKERQQVMRKVLDEVCERYGSGIEQAEFQPSCIVVQVLVPLDVAVGEVIEESVALLNRGKEEVCQDYLVTNVAEPTEEDIQKFLGELAGKQGGERS